MGGAITFRCTREAVGFEVAGAFLPPVLLAVCVWRWWRLHLGAGSAGDTWTRAHGLTEAAVCGGTTKQSVSFDMFGGRKCLFTCTFCLVSCIVISISDPYELACSPLRHVP